MPRRTPSLNQMYTVGTGLVNSLNLKPEVVTVCWEAFSVNKKIKALTDHSWQSFSAVLRKEADKNPSSGNTPMNEEDDDDAEGAVVRRRGLGKRQAGSPADSNGLALVTPPTKRTATNSRSTLSAVDVIATTAQTPVSVKSNNSIPPPNLPRYEERTGAGKVILTYNPNNLEATASSEEKQHRKCDIFLDSFDTNVSEPYRHLFTTMEDRAKALDQQLVRMEQILMQRYNIGTDNDMPDSGNGEQNDNAIAPLEVVGVPRQEKICNIGRICNAVGSIILYDIATKPSVVYFSHPLTDRYYCLSCVQAHEGRINQTSVVLEGSKHTGGARVEVDLSHLQADKSNSFSLFPGQIVAIEGVNSTGRKLVAHRICEGAAHGPIKSTAKQLLQYHHNESFQNGAPLKIMTVSGPYTTSDDLSYQPILDFFNQVMLEKPDVVIMVGPFVDMRHDHIQSGKFVVETEDGENLLLPPESFFCHHIAGILEQVFYDDEGEDTDMQTQFVLVPSLDDVTAEWV